MSCGGGGRGWEQSGAGIAELVVCWGRCPACCSVVDSVLLWGEFFSGRGDFSLGVNMGSDSIPPKTLSDENVNRSLVCTHMHSIARTPDIHVLDG